VRQTSKIRAGLNTFHVQHVNVGGILLSASHHSHNYTLTQFLRAFLHHDRSTAHDRCVVMAQSRSRDVRAGHGSRCWIGREPKVALRRQFGIRQESIA
jgi:hypothetical protein